MEQLSEASPKDFPWFEPWQPVKGKRTGMTYPKITNELFGLEETASTLEEELYREVSPGHVLFGVKVRAIGYNRSDPNEFLFLTSKPSMPFAVVHLTWEKESNLDFPYTYGYRTFEAFRSEWTQSKGGK